MTEFVELTAREEQVLEENLVWIFASPRSGTSWTSTRLLRHGCCVMNEPLIGSHLVDSRGLTDKRPRRHEENGERDSYFFCKEYEDVWKFYTRKLILNRIHAQFGDLSSRIIIKEPNGSFGADFLSSLFPRSRIIVMLRDGRDVINSQITALSEGGYAAQRAAAHFEPLSGPRRRHAIQANCGIWNRIAEILLDTYDQHEATLRYLLRYEDLISDTRRYLEELYNFIDVDISGEQLDEIVEATAAHNLPPHKRGIGTTIQFARSGVWKEGFNEEEQAILHNLIGETLSKLGYK